MDERGRAGKGARPPVLPLGVKHAPQPEVTIQGLWAEGWQQALLLRVLENALSLRVALQLPTPVWQVLLSPMTPT